MTGQGEMSDEDIRLAQIRAVRELIAGRANDDTVRVADLHEALDNPIGTFMVDMMTPGPREVLALIAGTVQKVRDRELTVFQAMHTIGALADQGLADSSDCTSQPGEQTPPAEGDRMT
jgi:hypothetical protein